MSWDPIANPVDYIVLGGKRSPGVATVSDWADEREWAERRSALMSGATLIYHGGPLLRGKVTLLLSTSEELAAWHTFKTMLERPPPARPVTAFAAASSDTIVQRRPSGRVLDIAHPQLADLGVHRVVVGRRGQLEQVEPGVWSVETSFIEHRPPVRAAFRPTSTVQATPALTARQQHVAALTNQVQALASGVNEAPP